MVRVDVAADTWAAFEMTLFDDVSAESTNQELAKSIGEIHAAHGKANRSR